jgi:formate dehydrogenase subunit gamma
MASATSSAASVDGRRHVVRYRRGARLFHTATYLITFVLIATGWWIATGHDGEPSVLADVSGVPDADLHRRVGWALIVLLVGGITIGVRAAVTFVRETARIDRGDGRWFLRWPVGALTGRFARHRGHFDPGQRVANVGFVLSFSLLIGTGIGLGMVSGGPRYAALLQLHRAAAYVLTALVVVHVLLAVGVLPGYRRAWRAMHLGGRTPVDTARRLWPASVEPASVEPEPERATAERAAAEPQPTSRR